MRIASAEDALLTELEWFEMGGRSSGRQWNDILGIMRRQGAALDLAYLRQWADALRVRDLLEDNCQKSKRFKPLLIWLGTLQSGEW